MTPTHAAFKTVLKRQMVMSLQASLIRRGSSLLSSIKPCGFSASKCLQHGREISTRKVDSYQITTCRRHKQSNISLRFKNVNRIGRAQSHTTSAAHDDLATGTQTVKETSMDKLPTGSQTVQETSMNKLHTGSQTVPETSMDKLPTGSQTVQETSMNKLHTGSQTVPETSMDKLPTGSQTVQEAITWWSDKFSASNVGLDEFSVKNIRDPVVSAKYIIAHAIGKKQIPDLTLAVLGRHLTSDEQKLVNELCLKRLERVPIQYLLGDWDFRNLTLLMRPPVFIPCPETEELVELVLGHYEPSQRLHFLEVGCGSGAICISLLSEMPQCQVTVVEKNQDACELTRENAERCGVVDRLTIHHDEWGSSLPSCLHGNQFDAIVSNPPYVATRDLKNVDYIPEGYRYIDNAAIDGGEDGLVIIKNICRHARHILNPNGFIWLETDIYQADMIDAWLQENSNTKLTYLRMYKDFTDRPRFCQLQLK